jgi:ubiquinone/menaquinone biosynthesis C-methylase UbiE
MISPPDFVVAERERMLSAYEHMPLTVTPELYAPWQPAEMLMREERKRIAAQLLRQARVFPAPGDPCLEIGFGTQGWLGDLLTWGLPQHNLHGIELDGAKVDVARQCLPRADLRVGDGTNLPWQTTHFQLVIVSTVLSSILDVRVRRLLAREIVRVLRPGGALLFYDFAVNSPANPHVRKVGRAELRELVPELSGRIRSVTLAPPISRLVAPRSWTLAALLQAVPLLRTHLLAVLVKP